jgi:hypothetical protein
MSAVFWRGDRRASAGLKVYVVSSRRAFIASVQRAFNRRDVGVFPSTADALEQVERGDRPRMHIVVIDLTTAHGAQRLIHFLKWATPTSHVVIIGVGHDGDFVALAPDALRLLDRSVKFPVTPTRLAVAAAAAGVIKKAPVQRESSSN